MRRRSSSSSTCCSLEGGRRWKDFPSIFLCSSSSSIRPSSSGCYRYPFLPPVLAYELERDGHGNEVS